ncbi:hypothetical protein K2X30_14590 [bacterium]|nr:hypothetical protein [bacterium]
MISRVTLAVVLVLALGSSFKNVQAGANDLNYYCSSLGSDQPMTLANCQAFCSRHIDVYGRERLGQCLPLRVLRIGETFSEELEPFRMVEGDELENAAPF